MHIPDGLLFTKEHEWVKIEGETATIGISEYAQHALGDITFVELPKINTAIQQFQTMTTIESVKAASDIYAPISGTIIEVNTELENNPALVNQNCYTKGWIAKIKVQSTEETKNLMDKTTYTNFIQGLEH
ncbi:MAG: glycine cleavage system protein GcvH [Candidatus Omnitrophota bacterium]